MTSPVLSIRSLAFSLGGKAILQDVSLDVTAGETWSIIGANGAGKSTLVKCVMRIHTGWTGHVKLHDKDLGQYSQRELARQIAYVPQPGSDQRFPFTVREFVRMSRYAYAGPFGTAGSGDQEALDTAMTRANVSQFGDRTLDSLSGGERQKVYIAAALAQEGGILLLDEPTAFLDYRHQDEVAEILHALTQESGTTCISVTHDVNAAMLTGGKALALRDGRVVWQGPTAQLSDEDTLEHIYGTAFRFLDDPVTGLRLVAPQGGPK